MKAVNESMKQDAAYRPIQILLQTTIPATEDDWSVERFSLLRELLASLKDESGRPLCEVVARNREVDANGDDMALSSLDRSEFDELWLIAVDTGNGLTRNDCAAITRFRERGGGILSARDHQDLGASVCTIGGIGAAHFFHSRNLDPDASRRAPDDAETKTISWPNFHSGSNGDYQRIRPVDSVHELLRNPNAPSGVISYFPAHPHEGDVGVPAGEKNARVIATGVSQTTKRPFNIAVAFERVMDENGDTLGRAVAESSFHHFVDYNWDIEKGAPSFVAEPPGDEIKRDPGRLEDIKTYVRNLAVWLAPEARP
jgi:hypothetical protein